MTPISRTITRGHKGYIANRFVPALYPNIFSINQIRIDIRGSNGLRIIDKDTLGLCFRFGGRKTDNHTMHMRFLLRFAIPSECPVREVDMDSEPLEQGLPNCRHLLALRDAVGGNKGAFGAFVLNE